MSVVQSVKTRAEFDVDIERLHLRGQWQFDEEIQRISKGAPATGVPCIWKWSDVHAALVEACDVMPDSLLQRRNLGFENPGLSNHHASKTITGGVQYVTPGEVAWGHRHTMGAIRFGIEGDERLYTVVDGDRLPLCANDLVLTPAWTWHDHHNEMPVHGAWLDVLDIPALIALGQAQFEPFGDATQPPHAEIGNYASTRAALVRPSWEERQTVNLPLRYAWSDVEPVLRAYRTAPASPYDDVLLEYVNPMTGGSTLPTLGCYIQLLRPNFSGASHKRASCSIYHVVEGEGVTICGDTELHWSAHDSFVVPNWTEHRHVNRSSSNDAILFSATDRPLLQSLHLYREMPSETSYLRAAPIAPGNSAR